MNNDWDISLKAAASGWSDFNFSGDIGIRRLGD